MSMALLRGGSSGWCRSIGNGSGASAILSVHLNRRSIIVLRQLKTCSVRASANTKTPIQKWGWEYLQQQKALKRPLSPHLQIYQPQLTWMLSGAHRITACIMAGTLFLGAVGFAILPFNFTQFIERIRHVGIPSPITAVFKFIIAYPIIFHTLNGIRFLGFDLAKGTSLPVVYRSGYVVLAVSALLALIVTFAPRS